MGYTPLQDEKLSPSRYRDTLGHLPWQWRGLVPRDSPSSSSSPMTHPRHQVLSSSVSQWFIIAGDHLTIVTNDALSSPQSSVTHHHRRDSSSSPLIYPRRQWLIIVDLTHPCCQWLILLLGTRFCCQWLSLVASDSIVLPVTHHCCQWQHSCQWLNILDRDSSFLPVITLVASDSSLLPATLRWRLILINDESSSLWLIILVSATCDSPPSP